MAFFQIPAPSHMHILFFVVVLNVSQASRADVNWMGWDGMGGGGGGDGSCESN